MNIIFTIAIFTMLFLGGSNVRVALGLGSLDFSFFALFMTVCYVLGCKGKIAFHKSEYFIVLLFLSFFFIRQKNLGYEFGLRDNYRAFMLAPLAVIFFTENNFRLKESAKKYLRIVKCFYLLECFIAIFERVTLTRIFPNLGFDTGFEEYSEGFRSYALLGHPLSNAAMVLLLMNLILVNESIKDKQKIIYWTLGFAALLCFNGRLAIFLSVACFAVYLFKTFFKGGKAFGNKFVVLFFVLVTAFLVFRLINSGWGDRIFLNADTDNGSANARFAIFDIFSYTTFSLKEILFGAQSSFITGAQIRMGGSDLIIENPWLLLLFRYGLVVLVLAIFSYVVTFAKIFKGCGYYKSLFIIIPWLIQASSSNGLAGSGTALTNFITLVFIFKIFDKSLNNNINKKVI